MLGKRVNPMAILPKGRIATKWNESEDGVITIKAQREVKRVTECSDPNKVHLDGECYDSRFSTVVVRA